MLGHCQQQMLVHLKHWWLVTIYQLLLGGNPTGSGTVGPYTYLWSPPLNFIGGTTDSSANPILDSLGSGTTFCVTVTDAFGCSANGCVAISVDTNKVVADAGGPYSVCGNSINCVILNGSETGGTNTVGYNWYNLGRLTDFVIKPSMRITRHYN